MKTTAKKTQTQHLNRRTSRNGSVLLTPIRIPGAIKTGKRKEKKDIMQTYNLSVLGGSFAPITRGHISTILTACNELNADGILVPSSDAYVKNKLDKKKTENSEFWSSYEKCRGQAIHAIIHATKENATFLHELYISHIELNGQAKAGHTLETLDAIASSHKTAVLYFIMGSEKLKTFRRWKTSDELLSRHKIAVVPCRGENAETIIEELFPKQTDRFVVLKGDMKTEDISSTNVRLLANCGNYSAVRSMTCTETAEYIKDYMQNKKED